MAHLDALRKQRERRIWNAATTTSQRRFPSLAKININGTGATQDDGQHFFHAGELFNLWIDASWKD